MRRLVNDIGRVCLKNLASESGLSPQVDLNRLCDYICRLFNIRVSPEVMARLFRHTAGMISSVEDGVVSFTDEQSDDIPTLVQFCLANCEQLKAFALTIATWNSECHFYPASEILDFRPPVGKVVQPVISPRPHSRPNSEGTGSPSVTPPRHLADPVDSSYYANPLVPNGRSYGQNYATYQGGGSRHEIQLLVGQPTWLCRDQ